MPTSLKDNTVVHLQDFDPALDHWTTLPDLSLTPDHQGMAGAALNGQIVVRSGAPNQDPDYYTTVNPLGRSYQYDTAAHTWMYSTTPYQASAPYPPHGQFRSGATRGADGNLYFIGGDRTTLHDGTAVDLFDAGTGRWSSLPSLPVGLIGPAVAADGYGHIYAVGGQAEGTAIPATFHANVFVYTIATRLWTALAPLPHALGGASAVMGLDGTLYVLGGEDDNGGLSTVYSYDPGVQVTTGTTFTPGQGAWSSEASLPAPVADAGATMTSDGVIYLVGGTPNGLTIGYPDYQALATVYVARIGGVSPQVTPGTTTPELGSGALALIVTAPCVLRVWRRRRGRDQ